MLLFDDSVKLLKGSAFTSINDFDTYTFLESAAFLNEYIVPKVKYEKLATDEIIALIKNEEEKNKPLSFYVSQTLKDDYTEKLSSLNFSFDYIDIYMLKVLNQPYKLEVKEVYFNEVDDETFDEYLKSATSCFPEWDNEGDYTKYFYNLSRSESTKIFKNFILKDSDLKSFASVIIDKELNLAYIHNAGTAEDHRRQGYFTEINKYVCNYALREGVNRVYSIVADLESSYYAYQKLEFVPTEKYYIYS